MACVMLQYSTAALTIDDSSFPLKRQLNRVEQRRFKNSIVYPLEFKVLSSVSIGESAIGLRRALVLPQ